MALCYQGLFLRDHQLNPCRLRLPAIEKVTPKKARKLAFLANHSGL